MDADDVIGLDERLDGDLPVAGDPSLDPRSHVTLFEGPALEMSRQLFEIVLERCAVGIEVDEHEAAPGRDLRLGQSESLVLDLGEVPAAGHVAELALEVPGEAVEGAADPLEPARLVAQPRSAMEAGVVIGAQVPVARAQDDEGIVGEIVDEGIARRGHVLDPPGDLPDPPPESLDLAAVLVGREVGVDRQVGVAQGLRGGFAQDRGAATASRSRMS